MHKMCLAPAGRCLELLGHELLSEIRKRHSEPIIVIDDGSDKEVRSPRDLENIHILKTRNKYLVLIRSIIVIQQGN